MWMFFFFLQKIMWMFVIIRFWWYAFRWSLIAGRLPGRTDNEVRIHWETYLEKKLMKMGIDPTNHRLYHHTNYTSRRYINASYKKHETDIISDQSSSVSESCNMTLLPVSSTKFSKDNATAGHNWLPDLNIGLVPMKTVTSLPVCSLQEPSESSNHGSTSQETLLLFRWRNVLWDQGKLLVKVFVHIFTYTYHLIIKWFLKNLIPSWTGWFASDSLINYSLNQMSGFFWCGTIGISKPLITRDRFNKAVRY